MQILTHTYNLYSCWFTISFTLKYIKTNTCTLLQFKPEKRKNNLYCICLGGLQEIILWHTEKGLLILISDNNFMNECVFLLKYTYIIF